MLESVNHSGIQEIVANQNILKDTFIHPTFTSHLAELINHAHDNLAEGSFYVQNTGHSPLISSVNKSPPMGSIEYKHASYSTFLDIVDRDNYDYDQHGNFPEIFKKNIFLFIHSHPIDPHTLRSSGDSLVPSSQDFDVWERMKLETHNLKLIEGIVTEKGRRGLVLLFQSTLESTNYYQYRNWANLSELQVALDESKIQYGILKFDPEKRKFPKVELAKLEKFIV